MKIEQFAMERMQSTWENQVQFNLSESGVHPLRLSELVRDPADRDALLAQELGYTQANGTPELREAISALYPGTTVDHIEVTNGGSEANFIVSWKLIEPGDEVVVMVPNYGQTLGLTSGFGARLREWRLRPSTGQQRWTLDFDDLRKLVNERTRLIAICNPNNPTGARFDAAALDEIAAVAGRVGAWILADEIFRGAELDGQETPSMWGRTDRVIITSGMSKAYGLPGLRIGWIVGNPDTVATLWSYHDYTTIGPGTLSDRLARIALRPDRRAEILARTRRILTTNFPIVEEWLRAHSARFSAIRPEAGAIVYVRFNDPMNSTDLVNLLRERQSVLIVPGDHFGMDGYLRIGFGPETRYLREGLDRIDELFLSIDDPRAP